MSMKRLRECALFILANAAGSFGAAFAYHTVFAAGLVAEPEKLAGSSLLADHFFGTTMLVWMGCALLSVGFFFIKAPAYKTALLLLPALLPYLYGLAVLLRISSAL
jgi:hypothetical protein